MAIGTSLAPYHALVEGQEFGGEIVDFRIQQKREYEANGIGAPMFFERTSDGKTVRTSSAFDASGKPNVPICDWVVTVDCGVEDDNGDTERRIFIDPRKGARGTDVEGRRGQDAIVNALKQAKAHRVGLEIGGQLFITRGPKVAPRKGEPACVTYTARYIAPVGGIGTGRPVDETQYLTDGTAYSRNARPTAAPAQPPVDVPAPSPVDIDEPPF